MRAASGRPTVSARGAPNAEVLADLVPDEPLQPVGGVEHGDLEVVRLVAQGGKRGERRSGNLSIRHTTLENCKIVWGQGG